MIRPSPAEPSRSPVPSLPPDLLSELTEPPGPVPPVPSSVPLLFFLCLDLRSIKPNPSGPGASATQSPARAHTSDSLYSQEHLSRSRSCSPSEQLTRRILIPQLPLAWPPHATDSFWVSTVCLPTSQRRDRRTASPMRGKGQQGGDTNCNKDATQKSRFLQSSSMRKTSLKKQSWEPNNFCVKLPKNCVRCTHKPGARSGPTSAGRRPGARTLSQLAGLHAGDLCTFYTQPRQEENKVP